MLSTSDLHRGYAPVRENADMVFDGYASTGTPQRSRPTPIVHAPRTADLFDCEIASQPTALSLSQLGDDPLPVCVDSFSVDAGDATLSYEVWLESGDLTLSADEPSSYDVTVRFVTYAVTTPNGLRRRVGTSREHDRGIIRKGSGGDLVMTSSSKAQLVHSARDLGDAVRMVFCAPGDGDEYDLLFRRASHDTWSGVSPE